MEIDPKLIFPLITGILMLIAITTWIIGHKKYKSILWIDKNRDFRIPVEYPSDTISGMNDPDVKELNIQVLGAYLRKDGQWVVDLRIGQRQTIFTGELKISVRTSHLFVRFECLGSTKDLWL